MNERATKALETAVALDDGLPLNVCPGCGQDITGWEGFEAHLSEPVDGPREAMTERARRGLGAIWTSANHPEAMCGWTRDYLAARLFRRNYILRHQPMDSDRDL